ncbi:MAG: chemotaxis protein CheB, partial [Candidatus Binatia bacterium]
MPAPIPVVGVGASAGGLDAFTQILEALGDRPGVALVFIQHLAPKHESALPALLAARTNLRVLQVTEGVPIQMDTVYVIPPNAEMAIREGELHLTPRPEGPSQYNPIDFFLRSLADTAGSGAIGVVLSGSSSDGAAGLREIRAVGGITIAQDPKSARYDAMPRAAVATGTVDLVLAPADIAKEIQGIGRDPYVKVSERPRGDELTMDDDQLRRLAVVIRNAAGIDFTLYKQPTIKRRLQRRMMLRKIADVGQYLRLLQNDPEEAQKLAQDILINVTRFFREPESFAALAESVFPELVARQAGDMPIRIWVPGCSTGEEAYSIAIALLEHLGERSERIPIQVFGTDVSEAAINYARNGVYSQAIGADVSPERLRRFFVKSDSTFRVSKSVRGLCVFARQDLTRDPPFSKLDLVACRNVLIYLGIGLQKKLLNVFHYALKPTGFLMLGHAETTGPHAELFRVTNKKNRIYGKNPNVPVTAVTFANNFNGREVPPMIPGRKPAESPAPSLQNEVNRFLLDRFAPPGVIVDDELRIIQFLGHTGRFLEPAPGEANLTLAKMVRDGLLHALRTAFFHARREGRATRREGLHARVNGRDVELAIEVAPLGTGATKDRHYLVLFD